MIKVLIVDDSAVIRMTMTKVLSKYENIEVIGMDVTECNAAHTIQDLEMKVAQLDTKFYEIKMILSKENIEAYKRVRMASEVLSY